MEYSSHAEQEFMDIFSEALQSHQLELSDEKRKAFFRFYVELIETNKVMNLTAITDQRDVIYKHFIDCLMIEKFDLLQSGMKVIDVGTGAGFPGLVLAIRYDDMEFVLMDSLQKRIHFLSKLCDSLELQNVSLIHARAEELAFRADFRECFDVSASRAVANLSTLSEYCLPFVKQGGSFIAYKSQEVDEEVRSAKHAIHILGGEVRKIEKFALQYEDNHRSFVVVDKKKVTPRKYPRKAGTPQKQPL